MVVNEYALVGLVLLLVAGTALLAAALWRSPRETSQAPHQWTHFRFGYVVYALIFLAFDMEMIYMYPWAVVLRRSG